MNASPDRRAMLCGLGALTAGAAARAATPWTCQAVR
jgi:hypothetical protein